MYTDIMREAMEKIPGDLMNFTHNPELQKYVRREIRPFLRKLAEMSHSDTLIYAYKKLN